MGDTASHHSTPFLAWESRGGICCSSSHSSSLPAGFQPPQPGSRVAFGKGEGAKPGSALRQPHTRTHPTANTLVFSGINAGLGRAQKPPSLVADTQCIKLGFGIKASQLDHFLAMPPPAHPFPECCSSPSAQNTAAREAEPG